MAARQLGEPRVRQLIRGILHRQRERRSRRFDVVFYTPFIGSMLTSGEALPPGGAETQILMLSRALASRGLHVAIIAYGMPDELPSEVDGVQIVPRPPQVKRPPIGKLVEAVRIWQVLWQSPSRTVVYRTAAPHLGLVALYTKVARRRLVFSTANVVDFQFKQLARNRRDLFLYGLGVRLADAIVVQTEEQIPLCAASFRRAGHLIKSLSELAEPQQVAPDAFLWVGRLVSYKQPLEYLALASAVTEAKFWMIGVPALEEHERPLSDAVVQAACEIENLELLAPRPHAEVERIMERAVASVNTAAFEGMPNVLLEGWCRGVPALVLAHDPGGVVTKHDLGGFAGGSSEQLAVLAREQWRTRNDRAALSERCRAYVAAHHAPDVIADQWLKVLSIDVPSAASENQAAEVEFTCAG